MFEYIMCGDTGARQNRRKIGCRPFVGDTSGVLAYLTPPAGYTYSTRILDEDLVLDANNHDGVVTVLPIRGELNSTWEKR